MKPDMDHLIGKKLEVNLFLDLAIGEPGVFWNDEIISI
jgi:hypothetical protein